MNTLIPPPKAICILVSPAGEEFYDAYGPMTKDRAKATEYVNAEVAGRCYRFGRSGQAFWNSERIAEQAAEKEYRGWTHRVEEVS